MSTLVLTTVFHHSQATGNNRLVLLSIADEADDDGTNSYPSIDRLALKARVPKRTVIRCLERLEELGELEVNRPEVRGRGHHNTYRVLVEKGATLAPSSTTPEKARKGAQRRAPLANPSQTHRPIDPSSSSASSEPVATSTAADAEIVTLNGLAPPDVPFDVFWPAWPPRDGKKLDRRKAEAEWSKLSPVDRAEALVGAGYLADAVRRGGRFGVPDAWRWLRDRRWADWQEPASFQPSTNGAQRASVGDSNVERLRLLRGGTGELSR